MTPTLVVDDLHVWLPLPDGSEVHAVRGISFSVDPGERFGLVGESGCGKSTALLAIMGMLPGGAEVSGQVTIQGSPVLADEPAVRRHRWTDVAMVFQGSAAALNPVLTIGAQVREALLLHNVARGRKQADRRAGELLELVGIPSTRGRNFPHELSGGMRQRAAIAMALSCDPSVLLADEPTTALDVMVQAQVLALLAQLSEDLGLSLVLVTHDLPVVAHVCSSAAVMYAGRLVERTGVSTLYHRSRHPYTAALFRPASAASARGHGQRAIGRPPDLRVADAGCAYAPRCGLAAERCAVEVPRLLGDEDHVAACHRQNEVAPAAVLADA